MAKSSCKMIDESIKDERKACKVEYPRLSKKLHREGRHRDAMIVEDIQEQECGHEGQFKRMKKEHRCK